MKPWSLPHQRITEFIKSNPAPNVFYIDCIYVFKSFYTLNVHASGVVECYICDPEAMGLAPSRSISLKQTKLPLSFNERVPAAAILQGIL
jgi:hypothetical protein